MPINTEQLKRPNPHPSHKADPQKNPERAPVLAPQVSAGVANTAHGQVANALEHIESAEGFVDSMAIAVADRMTPLLSGERFEQTMVGRLNDNLLGINGQDVGLEECDFSRAEALLEEVKKSTLPPQKLTFLPAA